VQGKADVNQTDLQRVLAEFAADRLALLQRHEASAQAVGHYDFNNTYQYVINREEGHLGWLRDALAGFGVSFPAPSSTVPAPEFPKRARRSDGSIYRSLFEEDSRALAAFVERWRPRTAPMTHSRHKILLDVIVGETLEHKRLFDQAASGFEDLLGRRTGGVARQGAVLPHRWME
jgi:hypothetical protein